MTKAAVKRTVAEIAAEMPRATCVFEAYGIDYCCGGDQTLEQACIKANVAPEVVERELAASAGESRSADTVDWRSVSPSQLIEHIVNFHHQYVRRSLGRLNQLFDQVMTAHGGTHRELPQLLRHFHALGDGLVQHMLKEEQMLFPYIMRLEDSKTQHRPAPPSPFGSVANPIRMMRLEHDNAGDEMKAMRKLTNDYAQPKTDCNSFRALYAALEEFERDLHQHVHLENNILFPEAESLEVSAQLVSQEGQ